MFPNGQMVYWAFTWQTATGAMVPASPSHADYSGPYVANPPPDSLGPADHPCRRSFNNPTPSPSRSKKIRLAVPTGDPRITCVRVTSNVGCRAFSLHADSPAAELKMTTYEGLRC
jgi:hypothetical protein